VLTALLLLATALTPTYPTVATTLVAAIIGIASFRAGSRAGQLSLIGATLGGIGATAGTVLIVFSVSPPTNYNFREPFELPLFLRESSSYVRILLLILGSFLLGLAPAIAAASPLPQVKITKRDEGEEVPAPPKRYQQDEEENEEENGSDLPKRYLVAHSDGHWHYFDENRDLLSIPDDQVASVRIVRKADTPPAKEPIHIRLLRFLQRKTK
jgi:hypothetical protein